MKIKLMNVLFCYRRKLMMKIMKAIIFLWCTTIFSFTTTNSFSQNAKISIKEDAVVSVDMVFDIIMEQTDYKFIYSEGFFDAYPKVVLHKGIIKANALLDKTLENSDVSYEFLPNKTIVIVKKSNKKRAYQLQIKGKVVDELGVPLLGMNVYVTDRKQNGSDNKKDFLTRGTSTDFDGNFKIMGDVGNFLYVGGIGFETYTTEIVEGKTSYNIVLKEAISKLDEVVLVSTGYQKISKERATGSYVGVSKKQIEKPSSSIAERLTGVVAGLQTTTNADGSIDIQIRGQSSLSANAQPLIVVDGFPIDSGLDTFGDLGIVSGNTPNITGGFGTINPNDVESVTVLKDAAAASIWGAKAANGVIVITTKKGKKGRTNVSVSSFVRASSKIDLDYALARANSQETLAYEQAAFDTNFFGSILGNPPGNSPSTSDFGPYSQAIVAMNEARLGRISDADRDATLNYLSSLDNKKQIRDNLLSAPLITQHNIAINGGTEKMSNSLSLMYEDSKTYFQGDKQTKYLINFKNNTKLSKRLNFEFSAMLQHNDIDTNSGQADPLFGTGGMLNTIKSLAPWDMLKNEDGSLTDMSYLHYYRPNVDAYVPFNNFPYSDWSYNPITEINNRNLNTKQLNARINAGLTLDLIKGMKLSSRIQYEIFNSEAENYYSDKTFDVRQFINETSGPEWNFGGVPTQLVPKGGILEQGSSEIRSYNFRNQLSYNRTFGDKHNIDFIAGTEMSNRVFSTTSNPAAFGYDPDKLTTSRLLVDIESHSLWNFFPARLSSFFYNFDLAPEHSFTERTNRFFSMYGNLAYTYNNKYTVSGSYRTDAANIVAPDPKLRYDPFWSVGLGWHVDKEEFMNNVNWVDRLSLRATYGAGGNIIPSASFMPLINLSNSLNDVTNQITASVTDLGNPQLRWEKTYSWNLGADFSLFNSKLNGAIDVYNKQGKDLIVNQGLTSVYGTTSQLLNRGEMVNKGVEVSLGTTLPINGNDIVWSGNLTFSHNKNEITTFERGVYTASDLTAGPTTSYREGFDANTLWSYQYGGMFDFGTGTPEPTVIGVDGELAPLTTFVNGDARTFMEAQGTTNAPTIVGFRNSFKIYDFNLSFIVTGKFGHVFRRQSFNYNAVTGGNTSVNEKYNEVANGDPNSIIPIPEISSRYFFYDRFYPYMNYLTENADHLRFQEVNLTYNLPNKVISKLGLNSLSFYAQANNVGVVLFNDFDEDPEFPKGTLRPQATFTFGMNLNF
ncbi:SusC/RagA family TonB-linked outer membrane protein [Cellulophaga geojensis]|nr:SusC/RagA family TonB-linked outer membrane protein [Cellulophaga geojensis]